MTDWIDRNVASIRDTIALTNE